ncbi:hypothetical protein KBT16_12520 [Nostoc sp. CCCryo 231-06]|nr:hypothetical protein [Nostoc sp. CCCryo 231-06]
MSQKGDLNREHLNESKNTPALANRIRGYKDFTHLRGFKIPGVRAGGQEFV